LAPWTEGGGTPPGMIGRKREVLEPKRQTPAKRRWQAELEDDSSAEEEITAEDLEQWRKREEHEHKEAERRKCGAIEDEDTATSKKQTGSTRKKRFAWMDSDEDDNGEEDVDEDDGKRAAPVKTKAPPKADLAVDTSPASEAEATTPTMQQISPSGADATEGMNGATLVPKASDDGVDVPTPSSVVATSVTPAPSPAPTGESAALLGTGLRPAAAPPPPPPPPALRVQQQQQQQQQQPSLLMQPLASAPAVHQPCYTGHMRPRPLNARSAPSLEDERFVGRIKRYVEMPSGGGYGFIDCEETKLRFTRDVYIHRNQMHGLQIGDEVTFTIVRNAKGEPQARNVMRAEDAALLRAHAAGCLTPAPCVPPTVQGAPGVSAPLVPSMQGTGCSGAAGIRAVPGMAGTVGNLHVPVPPPAPPTVSASLGAYTAQSSGLMDEEQAKKFQASLRDAGR